MFTDLSWGEIL